MSTASTSGKHVPRDAEQLAKESKLPREPLPVAGNGLQARATAIRPGTDGLAFRGPGRAGDGIDDSDKDGPGQRGVVLRCAVCDDWIGKVRRGNDEGQVSVRRG